MTARPAPLATQNRSYDRVLCAVDGSRGSAEAVREAIALAVPGGTVTFVAVTDVRGVGANRVASLGEHRADQALAAARSLARSSGVRVQTELVHDAEPAEAILLRAGAHQVLVAGSRGGSRMGGITTGSVATILAHRAGGPLLIARHCAAAQPFPQRVVIAVSGEDGDDELVRVGGRIAASAQGHASLVNIAFPHAGRAERHRLAVLAASLWEATGTEPLVDTRSGPPAVGIAAHATLANASLVIVGRRGLSGVRALGSVSERVVHLSPCSVLVVPTRADES